MKKCSLLIISLLFCFYGSAFSQQASKVATAVRTYSAPEIDGILNDKCWENIEAITEFTKYDPIYNHPPSFQTEIKIIYDDNAIYIGACMFDPSPDSILHQLGERDESSLNADRFGIELDTYNNHLDAYIFAVTASGVQIDYRVSDGTYNAVWKSKTLITKNGWMAELKIPYSAVRFPKTDIQQWGMQIYRYIRRYREMDQWTLEKKGAENNFVYWGTLNGIKKVESGLRLSVSPYFSISEEHYPYDVKGKSNFSNSINGGMDLKYGINESFTFDMTLLPDFSQVQSDNEIKNLSAFETQYSEQRPFFNEAVDLFQKGGLFYSRRIGKKPTNYDDVEDQLKKGEYIKDNPLKTDLINATKISGRNSHGLAIGIFNAITDKMYAKIGDSATGKTRKVLTESFANYNIAVIDKSMKNHSSFYLINTNVNRAKGGKDANVSAGGLTLNDRKNTYQLQLYGALSQIYTPKDSITDSEKETGGKYNASISKTNGKFKFYLSETIIEKTYDINDMGIQYRNNEQNLYADVSYNIYDPFWLLRDFYNTLSLDHIQNYGTKKIRLSRLNYQSSGTFKNYLSAWGGVNTMLSESYDYQEPRVDGRYYISPKYTSSWFGFSTDYRKPFAFDFDFSQTFANRDSFYGWYISLNPIVRINDKLTFNHQFTSDQQKNDIGYMDDDSLIYFGNRKISTITNTFSGKYLFNPKIYLTLRLRHYWSKGEYDKFYTLAENGRLNKYPEYTNNENFNFNAFNIDFVFGWEFAPGSMMNVVWKNAIQNEETEIAHDFYDNLNKTMEQPQMNNLSLKVLYYLDYQNIKKRKRNSETT